MPSKILAFDPGASCGWVVLVDGAYAVGGTRSAKVSSKDHRAKRWLDFRLWVASKITEERPDVVIVEDVSRHAGVKAAHAYGYYRYTIEAECAAAGIHVHQVPVGMWKKSSTGKGNADKNEVLAAMTARFPGIEFASSDHSDAAAMALFATTDLYLSRI